MGWMTPSPPASDTAATSSGLLHGYMAPQMSGTSMPTARVKAVSTAAMLSSGTGFRVVLRLPARAKGGPGMGPGGARYRAERGPAIG